MHSFSPYIFILHFRETQFYISMMVRGPHFVSLKYDCSRVSAQEWPDVTLENIFSYPHSIIFSETEFLERRDICVLNIPNPNSQSRHTPGQLTCSLNSSDFRPFHALYFLVLTAQLSGLLKYVIIWKPVKPVILVDKYVEQGTPNPYWVQPNTLLWSPQHILLPLFLSSCLSLHLLVLDGTWFHFPSCGSTREL